MPYTPTEHLLVEHDGPIVTITLKLAAWYVTDILKDAPPPVAAKGGRIAYKTGTSYGYRDAWAAGFDGKHTVRLDASGWEFSGQRYPYLERCSHHQAPTIPASRKTSCTGTQPKR